MKVRRTDASKEDREAPPLGEHHGNRFSQCSRGCFRHKICLWSIYRHSALCFNEASTSERGTSVARKLLLPCCSGDNAWKMICNTRHVGSLISRGDEIQGNVAFTVDIP